MERYSRDHDWPCRFPFLFKEELVRAECKDGQYLFAAGLKVN